MVCILVGGRPGGQPLRQVRGGAGPARWRLPHQRPALLRVAGGQRGQGEQYSKVQYSTVHLHLHHRLQVEDIDVEAKAADGKFE